jgi:hypothetical protein
MSKTTQLGISPRACVGRQQISVSPDKWSAARFSSPPVPTPPFHLQTYFYLQSQRRHLQRPTFISSLSSRPAYWGCLVSKDDHIVKVKCIEEVASVVGTNLRSLIISTAPARVSEALRITAAAWLDIATKTVRLCGRTRRRRYCMQIPNCRNGGSERVSRGKRRLHVWMCFACKYMVSYYRLMCAFETTGCAMCLRGLAFLSSLSP